MSMRETDFPKLHDIFLKRWSPRAFSPKPIEETDLMTLFEAARWSPSSYNEQPFRFLVLQGKDRLKFKEILMEKNWLWASKAPVLCAVLAKRHLERTGKENKCAEFDAGASWMSLAYQAQFMGISCHAMGGFYKDKAHDILKIPEADFKIMAIVAIGYQGEKETLPEDLQKMETPNQRRDLTKTVFKDDFQED